MSDIRSIKGYRIDKEISCGSRFRICRGVREDDSLPVLFKIPVSGSDINRIMEIFEKEYLLTANLPDPGAIPVLAFEKSADPPVLVLKDHGWIPLRSIVYNNHEAVPAIASEMVRALALIHSSGIVHRNLHCGSFMFLRDGTLKCSITGFEHSAYMSQPAELGKSIPRTEVELATASPENLGLIPFLPDFRSDLYSIGIIFYEMFTGINPFPYNDENDLIYAHIAREPVPPSAISGKISQGLSDIVMKLLSKEPDSRYQSSPELLRDMDSLYSGYDGTSAKHGARAGIRRPLFTDRMYGREEEMRECIEIFESSGSGPGKIILAGGPPGAGKTSFVTKFTGLVIRPGAFYGYSKYNRHGRNIPYSGIAAAFGRIIRQILSRSDAEIPMWRNRFIEALGQNLSVITDVIPELEAITGPQAVQLSAGDIEARNRFVVSFRKFAEVLAGECKPLVIFLDDIQWSDKAGLDLLISLVRDSDLKNILFICAYRDNEILEGDPLFSFINEMKRDHEHARFINIRGLPVEISAEMISDILQIPGDKYPELGDYIFRKTAGNPYYIREYIKTVCSGGLLEISPDGKLKWDIAGMDRLPASESLASVLNATMRTLDINMKNILAACACAGWDFSPYLIAAILRVPVSGIDASLDNLEREGYIVKVDDNYRFVHDRVRETAYELIPEQERLAIHRRSGRILFGMAVDDAGVFFAVEQMNIARGIISDRKERTDLAYLNFEAGIISLKRAAFAPALAYLRIASEMLPGDPWHMEYKLTGSIMKELAKCESLNGNTARTERIILESLGNLQTPEEKAEFLAILILQMNITGRFREAIDLALHALSLLGVEVPVNDLEKQTIAEMEFLGNYLERNGISSLKELGRNTDSRNILIIKIFLQLGWSSYFFNRQIMIYVTLKMMNLTIKYGLSRETIAACCCYIGVTGSAFRDYDAAFSLWKATEQIMEKLNDRYYTAEICLKAANYVIPMIMHLRESEPVNIEGYNAGYMSGELLCSGYLIAHKVVNAFHYGRELGLLLSEINDEIQFNLRIQNFLASDVMLSLQRTAVYLAGGSEDSSGDNATDESDDSGILFARIRDNDVIFAQVSTFSLQAFFIMGDYARCFEIVHSIRDKVETMDGIFTATEFNFYHSLTLAALMPDADKSTACRYRSDITLNQQIMKKWADRCPENFMHKYLLIEGELARLDGKTSDAMNYYDSAVVSAGENRFIQNEALANELAARFWISLGKDEFAGIYLRKARRLYSGWGALRKVRMIDRIYPMLIRIRRKRGIYDSDDLKVINRESDAVVRSLQAISGEIEFERLLHTLTRNILQFGGATRFVLMMEKGGIICAEAEGSLQMSDGTVRSEILSSIPVESFGRVPAGVIRYCRRTGNTVIVNDAAAEEMFIDDPYMASCMPKSYICVRNNYGSTIVMAYLENSLTRYAFTSGKVEVLKLISVQAAISLENARLYSEKKESVKKLAELGEIRDRLLIQYNEANQRAMQKRMDPHFVYNAIHTIHSLININPEEADGAVLLLGEMLHFLTDRSFEQTVPFNDEWRFTQLYLEFEKIRFPETLSYYIEKEGSFDGLVIPPLTIQPLVENAIRHGLRKKAQGGSLNISALRDNELVIIRVTDTGPGIKSDDLYSRSIGNILNRLRYNFEFAEVTLCNREQGGVKATVIFSLRKTFYER